MRQKYFTTIMLKKVVSILNFRSVSDFITKISYD